MFFFVFLRGYGIIGSMKNIKDLHLKTKEEIISLFEKSLQ